MGAVTQAGDQINEDAWGMVSSADDVSAAWVLDGVTGINTRNYLPGQTDAVWFVERANLHLRGLAALNISLAEILSLLVERLIQDWNSVSGQIEFPADYDPPASCLTLIKRYGSLWHVVQLGDCSLLVQKADGTIEIATEHDHDSISIGLAARAKELRMGGAVDIKQLLAEFKPQLLAQRKSRNTVGGLSILKAHHAALEFAKYGQFGNAVQILLCTDGFYRAVDCYGLYGNDGLMKASAKGVERVLADIRKIESDDPACQRFVRLKASDDATAIVFSI
ncbi:MAG: protein phosphatase 2C domain-containing protein [Aestuariivirga sp.]